MNKKLLTLVLTFTMLLSVVQIPALATETKYFYADFNSRTANASIGASDNDNGATTSRTSWFRYPSESGGANVLDVTRDSLKTSATIVKRGQNDNAMKLETSASQKDDYCFMYQVNQTFASNAIVHLGFDIKTDSLPGGGRVRIKHTAYDYTFVQFKADGTFAFKEKTIGKWHTGQWYNFDIYNDTSTNTWYLFINGKLEMKFVNSSYSLASFVGVWIDVYGTDTNVISNFYVDNLCICQASTDELKSSDKVSAVDYIPFTDNALTIDTVSGKMYDAVDSEKLSYANYEENGYVKYEYQGGAFGKEASDKALHIHNPAGYQANSKFGYANYSGFDPSKITAGAKLHYSTLFAIDDSTSSDVWIQGIMANDRYLLFNTKSDGSYLTSFGQPLNTTIERNKWYKLDFVITVGETGVSNNSLDVYINGKKANNSSIEFSDGSTDKTAITSLVVRTANYQTVDTLASSDDADYVEGYTKYKSDSFWLDDITSVIYTAENSIISPSVSFSNPNVTVHSDKIENIATTSVAQFIEDSYSATSFFVADTNGTQVSDTSVGAKGKTLVLSPLVGGNIYLPIYDIALPSDYTEPTVSITSPQSGAEFVYGIDESCTIEANADAYDDIESVSFYLDGSLLNTDTIAPYEYNWTIPDDAGNHTIKTSVTDSYGTTVQSDEINITVISNEAPTVTFEGLDAENSISPGEDLSFTLSAQDTDGTISKTELYINNEKYDTFTNVSSKTYNISLSSNGRYVLKAVTYDNHDASGAAECTVNVVKSSTTLVGQIDFEGYSVGKTFTNNETISNADYSGNAISFNGDRGKKEITSDNGNKFLKSGVASDSTTGTDTPYIAAEYFVSNAVIEYETDIIFSRNDITYNTNCRGEDKDGNAIHMWAFSFTADGDVKVYNGGANTDIGDYSANTWYRLKIKLDIPNHKYDFSLTNLANPLDKCEAIGFNFTDNGFYKLHHIRIVGNFTPEIPGYIGYDNVKMLYTANYPTVSGVTDNLDTSGKVACSAENLVCILSEAIGEITAEDIILENDYGIVTVESVELDGSKLVITPKDGFVPSTNYKLTIKSTAPLVDGSEFGFDTVATFAVSAASFDVLGGSFTSDSSGITFTADITNTTSQSKTATLVTATYKDGILIDVYSKTVTMSASDMVTADTIAPSASYDSVKAFVISDWSSGVPLSAKVFSFNK